MDKEAFIGTWKLIEAKLNFSDGNVRDLYPKPTGYIIYTADGYMSVAIIKNSNTASFAANTMDEGTNEEKLGAANNYLSYCGTYEIKGNKVIHNIEVSLFPNWVGDKQVRSFKFYDNKLELRTQPIIRNKSESYCSLIWQKV